MPILSNLKRFKFERLIVAFMFASSNCHLAFGWFRLLPLALALTWLNGYALIPSMLMGDTVGRPSRQVHVNFIGAQSATPILKACLDPNAQSSDALSSISLEPIGQHATQVVDVGQRDRRLFGVVVLHLSSPGDVFDASADSLWAAYASRLFSGVDRYSLGSLIQASHFGGRELGGAIEHEAGDRVVTRLVESLRAPQTTVRIKQHHASRMHTDLEVSSTNLQALNGVSMALPVAIGGVHSATNSESNIYDEVHLHFAFGPATSSEPSSQDVLQVALTSLKSCNWLSA